MPPKRHTAALSLREMLVAVGWIAALMAIPTVAPKGLANVIMVLATCFWASLILFAFCCGSKRAKIFATGSCPPILLAMLLIPDAINELPFVNDNQSLWRGFTDLFNPSARHLSSDPFGPSAYSRFDRVAVILHFVACVSGYTMLLIGPTFHRDPGEP